MVCIGSKLSVLDNTGVKLAKCIKVYGSSVAYPASLVKIVFKIVKVGLKVRKGNISKAVIVRLRKPSMRFSGYSVCFFDNSVVVLKKAENIPLGTRVIGTVFFELRLAGYMRIVILAKALV